MSIERPESGRIPARDALIQRFAQEAYSWVGSRLATEGQGWNMAMIDLIQPEGSNVPSYERVAGRLSGENRVMVNRLYGMAGARLEDSSVHYLAGRGNVYAEVVEIPVGRNSRFEEITHGEKVGTEFIPISTVVYFVQNA
jgi:hypothetical protein